jgi:hypothetical protein
MKTLCASLLVLFVLSLSPDALAAGGTSVPSLSPVIDRTPPACSTSLVQPLDSAPGGVLDPLFGARQATDCGTCADQFRACKIGCGCSPFGPPICVDTFTCDPADPCGAVCICRPL